MATLCNGPVTVLNDHKLSETSVMRVLRKDCDLVKKGAPGYADAPSNRFVLLHSICSQHPECRAVTERLTAYQPHRSLTSTVVLTEPPSLAATV